MTKLTNILCIVMLLGLVICIWLAVWWIDEVSGAPTGGEFDCGERSPDLAIEQLRITCENQHYNVTGKNVTIIYGIKTYCCPSPWLPIPIDDRIGVLGPTGPPTHPNGTTGLYNATEQCIFDIMFGDNSTVGFPDNITDYCDHDSGGPK